MPRVSGSLLDNIGMLRWHFDDVDNVRLEAGAHFVFGPQGNETPGEGSGVAHCIVCKLRLGYDLVLA